MSASLPRPALVVCRSADELGTLRAVVSDHGWRYVVASDDPRVHDACRDLEPIAGVTWLEHIESFDDVIAQVLRTLDVVNIWLESLGAERTGVPTYQLRWLQHAEGGATTQRLQDLALLIRSYLHLIERHQIAKVILCGTFSPWEDDVLEATAQSRGIAVERRDDRGPGRSVFRRAAAAILGTPYRVIRLSHSVLKLRTAARRRSAPPPPSGREIVFQLATAELKHVENIAPLFKELAGAGFDPLVLTCFASDASTATEAMGMRTEELAGLVPLRACVDVLPRILMTIVRARWKKRAFVDDPSLSYLGVRIGPLVWPLLQQFIATEVVGRYLMARALTRFFQTRRPLAFKPYGEVGVFEGYLASKTIIDPGKPLLFSYWLGPPSKWPNTPPENPIDFFLTTGAVQNAALRHAGVPAARLVTVGPLRYDSLAAMGTTHSPAASRELLGIPAGFDCYVLWDANTVLRGFQTAQEQMRVMEHLLLRAREHRAALIVKPHPLHVPGVLEQRLGASGAPVFYVPPSALPYHALNASDLLVTKLSTIAIEAMLLRKPVLSVMLDGSPERLSVFEDAVEYCTSLEDLDARLKSLLSDRESRAVWTAERLQAQSRFLGRYFLNTTESPVSLAARAIAARVRGEQPESARAARLAS